MENDSHFDLSKVAPHRHDEVMRRINILEAYLAKQMVGATAIKEIGLAPSTFWWLLKIWRTNKRPEALFGTGSKERRRTPISEEQMAVLVEAERSLPHAPDTRVVRKAEEIASAKGVELPGLWNMKKAIVSIRSERGLRPEGQGEILVVSTALKIPVRLREDEVAAPILTVVLGIEKTPVYLGMALSLDTPGPRHAAAALLDALSHPRDGAAWKPVRLRIITGSEPEWASVVDALQGLEVPVVPELGAPRSSRELNKVIGNKFGGILIKPDLTFRPPEKRQVPLPPGGQAIDLQDAELIVRDRLRAAFPGQRPLMVGNHGDCQHIITRLTGIAGSSAPLS